MAFFDDLGKKITNAGQSAVQKAKDMTDVARINANINDEEKKINNAYLQIGKLYVAMHSNDYEGDFANLIGALKEAEAKINEYRRQIQDIKGVTRCEKCGSEVANGMAFCSTCGAAMPKPEAPAFDAASSVRCSCGAVVHKDMRFCTSCGKPMASILENQAAPAPAPATGKVCPQCGTPADNETLFCTNCGASVNQ